MRKIESLMIDAVASRSYYWRDGDTSVTRTEAGTTEVHLHGNLIAVVNPATPHAPPVILVSLAGWDTVTTRSRLNALLRSFTAGAGVMRMKGKPVLMMGGRATVMDPEAFYPVPLSADTEAGSTLISNLHARKG